MKCKDCKAMKEFRCLVLGTMRDDFQDCSIDVWARQKDYLNGKKMDIRKERKELICPFKFAMPTTCPIEVYACETVNCAVWLDDGTSWGQCGLSKRHISYHTF